jgi:hypothetical protein
MRAAQIEKRAIGDCELRLSSVAKAKIYSPEVMARLKAVPLQDKINRQFSKM